MDHLLQEKVAVTDQVPTQGPPEGLGAPSLLAGANAEVMAVITVSIDSILGEQVLCLGPIHLILTTTLGGECYSCSLDKETEAQESHSRE